MIEICINDIGTFPEDFILAKIDIEKNLIESKIIEEKMSLEDFIIFLRIQDSVYLNGNQTIAFKYIEGKNNKYLFYTFSDEKTKEEAIDKLKNKLFSIKYDFSNLSKINMSDFSNYDFDSNNFDMFLINQNFYK